MFPNTQHPLKTSKQNINKNQLEAMYERGELKNKYTMYLKQDDLMNNTKHHFKLYIIH